MPTAKPGPIERIRLSRQPIEILSWDRGRRVSLSLAAGSLASKRRIPAMLRPSSKERKMADVSECLQRLKEATMVKRLAAESKGKL